MKACVDMPPLGGEEYAALRADIEKRGQQVPVEIDAGTGEVLDGANRLRICEELGLKPLIIERRFATQEQRVEQALKLNILRRHMDPVTWGEQAECLATVQGVKLGEKGRPKKDADKSATVADFFKSLGVSERTGQNRVAAAKLPEKEKQPVKEGKTTAKAALRKNKQTKKRTAAKQKNEELVAQAPAPHTATDEPCATVVLDPPWDFSDEGDVDPAARARPNYATMPLDEIRSLPVDELALPDAHIYLWITNRSLPKGFDLLDSWGFRYVTCLTWVKPSIGMGQYFRGTTEQVLFGVRGSLRLLRNDVGTHFEAPRGTEHSAKPAEFYELVESCSPGPWLEMFARRKRQGWKHWGAEAND